MSKVKPESAHNSKCVRPLHKRCPMYLQETVGSGYTTSAEPAIHSRFRVQGQLADAPEGAAGVDDPGT
eukprot:CAMPEP_0183499184 /NCGR_PEP_ID=MMETSP0371-20130417/1435_1 /TAXON_ID=268820 /ORGANISM="Peridinium aciculiferum, Strain PAER-2" /LENGTH=67 /DNA_ID=CAMNT_0025692901 /DNA_START=21 /DNA_END=221 /DNA_ORIENTATION=+